MKNINIVYASFFILGIIFISCRHEFVNNPNTPAPVPPAVNPCSTDSVYFVNEIMPLISSNCAMAGCHDNITHAEDVILTSYNNIMAYVRPGNAGNSKLYKVIIKTDNERMPPPPMAAFTQTQKDKIAKWINQGAKNNNCIAACDTAVFTYSGAIKNTIQNKCVGCHNTVTTGGGINLSTFSGVQAAALSGRLFGAVAQLPGYSPMPTGYKLSECEIKQIKKWIDAGSQNN